MLLSDPTLYNEPLKQHKRHLMLALRPQWLTREQWKLSSDVHLCLRSQSEIWKLQKNPRSQTRAEDRETQDFS